MNRLSHHALFLFLAMAPAFSQTPATKEYPTAGGAGGKVITVTSFEVSGPGTLREALNTDGPRIIRFAKGGEIWLKDKVVVHSPFVTVDGESAPAPGITVMGDKIRFRTHDIIVRHIRIRVGALLTNSDPQNRDGIEFDGAEDGSDPGYNALLENCSVSWAIDENVQIWGKGNHDIVIRNCLVAEGLAKGHPKGGTHSAGIIVGPTARNVVIQGNLLAHNAFRNPVVGGGAEALVVNNLIYDPGFGGLMIYGASPKQSADPTKVTAVGNVLIAGPSTFHRDSLATYHQNGINAGTQVYYADNLCMGIKAFNADEKTKTNAGGVEFNPFVKSPPVPLGTIKPMPSSEVEAYVLAHAGALPDRRDAVDARIIEEVKSRTGKIADLPSDERLHPQAVTFTGITADYAKLLEKYVVEKGVRYAAWKQNAEDMAALQRVVDSFAASKDSDLAFYLNAYNAGILHEVLKEYPVKGLNGPDSPFFSKPRINVGGRVLSFNALEQEIASRFHDPRTVFALDRASRGGPELSATPFSPDALGVQLDQAAGSFINSERGVREVDHQLALSKVFEWQKTQFPNGAISVIVTYRHSHPKETKVVYQDYDWAVDEAP